jgi:hypothetical protein
VARRIAEPEARHSFNCVRNGRSTTIVSVPFRKLATSGLVVNAQASEVDLHAPKDARDVSCGTHRQ